MRELIFDHRITRHCSECKALPDIHTTNEGHRLGEVWTIKHKGCGGKVTLEVVSRTARE